MRINHLNQVIISEDDLIEAFYRGINVNNLVVDDQSWIEKYNDQCKLLDMGNINWSIESNLSEEDFVAENVADWYLPDEYANFNIESYLLSKCKTAEQRKRVLDELKLFKEKNMIIVLRWLKYFVDVMRQNNLFWGIGRGSSVASYVLYLLGIHRVDSLKYDLDINEFLK